MPKSTLNIAAIQLDASPAPPVVPTALPSGPSLYPQCALSQCASLFADLRPLPPAVSLSMLIDKLSSLSETKIKALDSFRDDHPGWLGPNEQQFLYTMGRWCPGPLLEQGAFAGLSTSALAAGVVYGCHSITPELCRLPQHHSLLVA